MSPQAHLERAGLAHVISLRRPEAGNSLSAPLVEALHDCLDRFEDEDGRVLVLRGEGRNFCTGFDMSEVRGGSDADLLLRFVRIEQFLARLWSAPYPTLAVGQGRLVGAGADLFAACARRIVDETATFRFPGTAFGVVLGARRLAARVGQAHAEWLLASGEVVDAAWARDHGLATRVVDSARLPEAVEEEIALASRLDGGAYKGLRAALRADRGLDGDLAVLVRSAARPGLAQRINEFREETLRARAAG